MSSLTRPAGALQPLTADEVAQLAADGPLRAPASLPRPPSPPPARRSRRTPAHRAAERPPVVSRRMRRAVNDAQLVLAAAEAGALPAAAPDLKALFERRSRSEWGALARDADRAAVWRAFSELDDDAQAAVLAASGAHGRRAAQNHKEPALVALSRVDSRVRALIKERPVLVRPLVTEVEDRVVALPPGDSVVLRLPHALGRMVAHGVAQFHEFGHRSFDVGRERLLVIRASENVQRVGARLQDVVA